MKICLSGGMLWQPSTIIRRLSRLASDVVYATLTQRCFNFCGIDVVCRPRKVQELDGLGSTTRRYFVAAKLEIRLRQLRRRKEPKFFASRFFVSLIFLSSSTAHAFSSLPVLRASAAWCLASIYLTLVAS